MSTTPTEAHLRLANQLIGSPPSSLVWARVIADSEARAVEAATKKQPISTHLRQFDLVRFMRRELLDAELITEEEYAWLCMESPMARGGGSPSPRRLEDYDKLRERVRVLEESIKDALCEICNGPLNPMALPSCKRSCLETAYSRLNSALATPATPPAATAEKEGSV